MAQKADRMRVDVGKAIMYLNAPITEGDDGCDFSAIKCKDQAALF